jgi:hypothetical protein
VACEALPPGRTYGDYEVRAQAECARLCGSKYVNKSFAQSPNVLFADMSVKARMLDGSI